MWPVVIRWAITGAFEARSQDDLTVKLANIINWSSETKGNLWISKKISYKSFVAHLEVNATEFAIQEIIINIF